MATRIIVDREFDFVSVFCETGFLNFREAVGIKKVSRRIEKGRFAVVGKSGKILGVISVRGEYEITETWQK